MVGTKVKHGCEKHGNRYIVQSRAGHGIGCFEDGVEVVRVPIVANECIDCKPDSGLGGISFFEWSFGIRR